MRRWGVGVLIMLVAAGVAGASSMDEVRIETTELRGGVYMLKGRGGNIGVSAGEDGVVLIDDQYAPLTAKIRAAVADARADDVLVIAGKGHEATQTLGSGVRRFDDREVASRALAQAGWGGGRNADA